MGMMCQGRANHYHECGSRPTKLHERQSAAKSQADRMLYQRQIARQLLFTFMLRIEIDHLVYEPYMPT